MHPSVAPNLTGWGEKIVGRGSTINPVNRFEALHYDVDEWCDSGSPSHIRTQVFQDDTQTIIARNQSPDIGFETSVNPYRGCEHGCAYCYARPTHEYLGFSAGIDFESKILVKLNAASLLAAELNRPNWRPQTLTMSGVTDCYQPIERKLKITRACLQVLADFRNPTFIVTKNHLVTRDCDLLASLAAHEAAGRAVDIGFDGLAADQDGAVHLVEDRAGDRGLAGLQRSQNRHMAFDGAERRVRRSEIKSAD